MTRFESRPADWLSFPRALERVLAAASPLPAVQVGIERALGAALAEDVRSTVDLPPWDNSAMDGYAVRGEDVRGATPSGPTILPVVGLALPGPPGPSRVEPGQAVRIMTGAPVPPGADSVVRVEDTDREERDGRIRIFSDRDAGKNIRAGGEDMSVGDLVLAAGATLGPGHLSVLSAAGAHRVRVHRPPSVGIITSGDELVGPEDHDQVRAGRAIPDSNRTALVAAVRATGCRPHSIGIARDEEDSVRTHVQEGLDDDVLLTVGGASMGEADLFKRVLDGMGFELDFWRVRMRPGTPFSLGFLPRADGRGRVTVFGIPGNPASAFVTFQLLVRPYLLKLAGHLHVHRPAMRARAATELAGKTGLTHFPRVSVTREGGEWWARLTGPQGSGLVSSLGLADGLAVVPADAGVVLEGDAVDVILLGDGPGWLAATPFDE